MVRTPEGSYSALYSFKPTTNTLGPCKSCSTSHEKAVTCNTGKIPGIFHLTAFCICENSVLRTFRLFDREKVRVYPLL